MTYTFLVSDESINSHGFIVQTSGINLSNFNLNPIMLWMHERSKVIGRWENLRIEDNKLYADAVFDTTDPLGKEIARKVNEGFLKASSMGIFIDEQMGQTVTKSTIYEISIVDVGSNSNALKLYQENYQTLFLNNNQMELKEQLISVLSLENTADDQSIIQAVKKLVEISKKQEEQQAERIEEVLKLAVKEKRIAIGLEGQYRSLLKLDFENTKQVIEALPTKQSLSSQINTPKGKADFKSVLDNAERQPSSKNKSEWTLDDYRKFEPNTLRDNPKLYKELLTKEGINI